ncbi:beta-lactamase regulating signal transducer with metallopeptidase domain [Mariniflexile fucanivorans]|uniref:Beta-lactamase regulating signal transducer with metallopeptidase domain n=1 Tax=Mariniflexile fucanivorans TaxID=264023 RepID=A0A4R1RQF5_9FLAO|nr:M56 family metallopeptidase [Mariniflexile fucanivorans]TCL68643.1 beta-lactamase regulating signal transducer with metallopeptidase domain [Mariniflexile fucanivorans]
MLIYLLKSGFCLAVFYGFYKFLLEKESIHTFKRYYLLTSLIVSFCIPLITFTQYIEISAQIVPEFTPQFSNETNEIIATTKNNYLSIFLWSIYALGVFIFSIKFIKNIFEINNKIKRNPKQKFKKIIHVLLKDTVIPHTFFNYIFLNKAKFETNQIPKEVLLHEQTHAKQKHSLDVLFIEILQIIFWFNPMIYFIKHSIKLNHEFLADRAVIKHGVTPSTYQQILLAFSSNASEPQLANAINYSSIKKRFTIMKTQTSKTTLWVRSLILMPLLAILIYGFSDKKVITQVKTTSEERKPTKINFSSNNVLQKDSLIRDIYILINKENEIILNNKPTFINRLLEDINMLNPNLTDEQKRKFLWANIKHQTNTPKELIESIQNVLLRANIYSNSNENIEVIIKNNLKTDIPNLPFMPFDGLTKEDEPIYKEKLNQYKEWLGVNKPNSTLEETKGGFIIKNEKGDIITSTDPSIKSKPFKLEKGSPWSISVDVK